MNDCNFFKMNVDVYVGSILATSNPDSAYSDKSFGSSGSGGAAFDRRSSLGSRSSLRTPMHPPGTVDCRKNTFAEKIHFADS